MRLPPWLLVLVFGLFAALAWLAFGPDSNGPDTIEVASAPTQEDPSVVEVESNEAPTGDREASDPDVETGLESPIPTAMLRFLVRDAETGQPIVGARINHSHGFSLREEEAFTDADGRCAFARENISSEHGWSFMVYAEGYQIIAHNLPAPILPKDEVVVEVDRAGTLSGVVRNPDGSPAPLATYVIAWIGTTPDPEEFATYRAILPPESPMGTSSATYQGNPATITRTDARGEFRFTDIAATKEYQILAASEGMLSRSLRSVRPETSEPLELKLLYAWGICLDSSDSQGSPLPGNGRVFLDRGSFSRSFPDGRRPMLGGTDAALPLAGLPLEYTETLVELRGDRFVHAEYSENEVAPSVEVSIQPPGFARHQAEYTLVPLNSKFKSTELRFDRIATQFGALEVEIAHSPLNEANRGDRPQSIIIAKLYPLGFPESGRDDVIRFALVHPENGLQRFSGIPAGEYWLGFESANRLLKIHWETQRIVIGSTLAKAQLELGSVGALKLNVLAQDGSELPARRTWVRIKSLSDNPLVYGQIMLKPGENQIRLIPSGDYELALVRETAMTHALVPDVPIQFSISAGKTSLAAILLTERN
jgi:hypothetical protein